MKRLILLLALLAAIPAYGQWNGFQPNVTGGNTLKINVSDGDISSTLGLFKQVAQTFVMTTNATNYVYLDLSVSPPVLKVNTTGFPTVNVYQIATATTDSGKITAWHDSRPPFNSLLYGGGSGSQVCFQINGTDLPCEPKANIVSPLTAVDNPGATRTDIGVSVCAGGSSHTSGVVPDPGVTPDLTKFLRSDCTLAVPPGSGGTAIPNPTTAANLANATAPWQINVDTSFGGNNPYIDARTYGVRAVIANAVPAIPGITANISSGANSAVISSASTFQNGDGVVIWGAGATNTMSTPSVPTVVPSIAAANTGSLLDVAGPSGATSYNYQIAARDFAGGISQASGVTSISTGQTLGPQAVSISSISLANNLVTVTTSAPHTLATGALVIIEGVTVTGGSNPFNGWFIVAGSTNNTHFTYTTMSDSRNGATTTGTAGNAHWWNSNHITWTAVAGAFQYLIYGRSGGSLTLIGVSWPQNATLAGDATYLAFDDFGSTLTTAPNLPAYVPNTPPGANLNDMLATTITSGAGTSTLTLADNAGNSVTGATILFDDGITLLVAANATNNLSLTTAGTLYLPWPSLPFASYVINSPMTLPSSLSIIQNGNVALNETINATGVTWKGEIRPQGIFPQFGIAKTQGIFVQKAYPGIYTNGNAYFSFVTLQANNVTSNSLMIQDLTSAIPASTFEDVQFALSNGGGTDYMSTGLVFRSNHTASGSAAFLRNVTFTSSQNTPYTTSSTPGFYADNFGVIIIDHIFFSGRGMLHRPTVSGGSTKADFIYSQAGYMPMFAFVNPGGGNANMEFTGRNITFDTTLQPGLANWGGLTLDATIDSAGSAISPIVTGTINTFVTFQNGLVPVPGQNTSTDIEANTLVNDGTFGRGTMGIKTLNAGLGLGPGYSLFTNASPGPAPTCAAASGGSVPSGTITYYYAPIWSNGSEGVTSLACSVSTSPGNQTVTGSWTSIVGATGYNIYRASGGGYSQANIGGICTTPQVTSASFTDTSSFTCGPSAPQAAAGGPAGIQGSRVWSNTATIGQYIDFAGLGVAPSNPSAGYCRTYYDSVAGTTKGINSSGTSCSPTGGGGTNTINNALFGSLGWYSAAGTSNFISGAPAPSGPNSVPNFWVTIPSANLPTAPQAILAGVPGRVTAAASGVGADIVSTDRTSRVKHTNAGATAISLPGAGTTNFGSSFCYKEKVVGSGAVDTITPVSGTINGGASLAINQGQDALVCSYDNSNYEADPHDPPLIAGTNITLTRSDTGLTVASTSGGGTVTNVATSLPAGQLLAGNTYPDIVKTDLSGDATTSGSAVTTVVKVNGVAYGTSPSTNTVPVVTSSNTVTYEAVPNAALAHAATTVNGQTCTLGSTCNANAGSTAHGVAVNEGDGAAIASTAAGAQNAILSGVTSADPTYKSLVDLSSELYAGTATGSVNVLAGCPTNAATALTTGMQVSFLPNLANTTTTPTFNLCTLGAKTIIKTNAAALATNDLITGMQAVVRYDGTNWELQNPQTTSGGGGAPVLSTITAASATNTIASGNFAQIWNWAQTSNSQAAFTFGETSAATNGTVTSNLANQSNVTFSTASASTATPLSVVQGSVTGTVAFPALQVATTWNNGSLVGQGIVFRLTDTAHAAGSKIFNIFGGAAGTSSEFSVDTAGGTTIGGVVRVPTVPATGTGTTAIPNTFLNPGASAVTSFNTAGTFLGVNANSGFTGNMFDFHVNGGASVAALNYQGNLTVNSCTGCGTGNLNIASTRWGILAWSHANGGINTSGFITGSGGNVCTTAGDTAATATNPSYKTCGTGASANTTQYLGVANGDTFIGSSSNPNNLDLITFAKMSATTTTRAWMAEISDVGTLSNLGTSDSPTGNNVAAIRFSSVAGDTNYMLVLCNAAACNATSTGVAGDTNKHHFEVRMNDVTGTATGCVDGTCVSSTTDYPSSVATGGFGLGLVLDNTTTTVETLSWSTTTVTTAN